MSVLQNFYKTTITRNWTATTGDFNVAIAPTPTSGWLVVSPNNSTLREIVYYSATGSNAYGAFITISNIGDRGIGGTTAQTHTIGETVRMNVTAEHWAEMNATIAAIIAAGAPDASSSTKGLVEEASDAEIEAGTDTGSTGARLFTVPSKGVITKTVNISSAELQAINSTPKELIPAPGAGKAISIIDFVFSYTHGGISYTSGNTLYPVYSGGTTAVFGTDDDICYLLNAKIVGGSSFVKKIMYGDQVPPDMQSNTAINLYSSGNFATGNGTFKIFITYKILTL